MQQYFLKQESWWITMHVSRAMAEMVHPETVSSNFLFYMNYEKVSKGVKPCSFSSVLFVNGQMINGANSSAGQLSGLLKPHDPPFLKYEDWEELQNPDGELTNSYESRALGITLAGSFELLFRPGMCRYGGALNWQNKSFLTW